MKTLLPDAVLSFARKLTSTRTARGELSSAGMEHDPHVVLHCCIAYNKYGGYCVPFPSRHRPAAQAILAGKVWEPATIEFMMSHGKNGDIIHAGTYFGDFLPALSHSCASDSTIWAFEPNRENYRCALITTHINGLNNIKLFNAALGNCHATVLILTTDSSGKSRGGASRVLSQDTSYVSGGTETAEMTTVDETVPSNRQVSIIQLDIEGFEEQALQGAIETIRRCFPILVLEKVPKGDWFSKNILRLGYRPSQTIHRNAVLMRN